jgi:hypothetical protein
MVTKKIEEMCRGTKLSGAVCGKMMIAISYSTTMRRA